MTGVFVFDNFVRELRKLKLVIRLQYHDEIFKYTLKDQQDEEAQQLKDCIQSVNDRMKLNVPLGVSLAFGDNYAEVH